MRPTWDGFHSPLAEGIQAFLAYKRALGESFLTEEYALRALDAFLVQRQAHSTKDMTPQLIESFLASRPRKRPRSYNHLISVVRRLFHWLVIQSYLDQFPLYLQTRQETSQRMPFLFTPAMTRELLACAGKLQDSRNIALRGPTYRTIFALLYGLGLRVGEVCRLSVSDLDIEKSLLVIQQTKFYKRRLVPFGPRMKVLLEEYLEVRSKKYGPPLPEGFLFTFFGDRPVNRHTIGMTFQSLIPQLGLRVPEGTSPPRLHDLRHSFAVGTLLRLYRAGIDPGTRLLHLSTFMGHVNPTSTAVYLNITPDLLQEANLRFEQFAAPVIEEALI